MINIRVVISAIIVFLGSLGLFSAILYWRIPTDIQDHADMIRRVSTGDMSPPANFFYYLTVWAVALFRAETTRLYVSSALVLSLAVTAKYLLTCHYSARQLSSGANKRSPGDFTVLLFSAMLLLAFSFPTETNYIGQIPPNVWHNSTTIFMMPFAIALFWISAEYLSKPTRGKIIAMSVLCVLNVMVKPSYFFVFAIVYPLMVMISGRFKEPLFARASEFNADEARDRKPPKSWLVGLIPVFLGAAALLIQYYLIFKLNFGSRASAKSGIEIRPFGTWRYFSSNIPLSLLFSILFPAVYLRQYWRDLIKRDLLLYAWLSFLASLVILSLFMESGPRRYHGNFIWQAIACNYMLFCVTAVLLMDKIRIHGLKDSRNLFSTGAMLLHVIAGANYLIAMLLHRRYG